MSYNYHNGDTPYEKFRDPRELNVVERIRNEAALKAALPKMNEEPVCMSTLQSQLNEAKTELRSPTELILQSTSGKKFVVTVSDTGSLESEDMIDTAEELLAAIKAGGTIVLHTDIIGGGIVVPEGSNFILDLNGYTYTVVDPTVGSTGTETLGFQLLKDSDITIKNGTIKTSTDACKMLIQNYSNLTLEDVVLDGTGSDTMKYVLSNNNGKANLIGGTSIIAPEEAVALDAYYWPSATYESVHVLVDTTGSIEGKIEYTQDGTATDEEFRENSSLQIKRGRFTINPIAYLAEDTEMYEQGSYYIVG